MKKYTLIIGLRKLVPSVFYNLSLSCVHNHSITTPICFNNINICTPIRFASSMNSITCQRFHIISSINLLVVNSKLALYSLCSSYAHHFAHTVPVLHCALTTIHSVLFIFSTSLRKRRREPLLVSDIPFIFSHTRSKKFASFWSMQACIEAIQIRSSRTFLQKYRSSNKNVKGIQASKLALDTIYFESCYTSTCVSESHLQLI